LLLLNLPLSGRILFRLPLNLNCPDLFFPLLQRLLRLSLRFLNTRTFLDLSLLFDNRLIPLHIYSLPTLKFLGACKCLGTLSLRLPLLFRRFLNLAPPGSGLQGFILLVNVIV
jgi:hypothetical protein